LAIAIAILLHDGFECDGFECDGFENAQIQFFHTEINYAEASLLGIFDLNKLTTSWQKKLTSPPVC